MRKTLFRLAQWVLAPFRADETFETDFDDADQRDAARAFRSHGCRVRPGAASLRLRVTLPQARRVPVRVTADRGNR